jgi:voltage-gated potassium channel
LQALAIAFSAPSTRKRGKTLPIGLSAVESVIDTGDFHSLWDAIWWAVVTVTNVGYGDIVVTSVQGRMVAMVVMLVGIGFVSVLTATIASHFVKTDRATETTEIMATLKRVEAGLAELRRQLARP